jgi:anti-sigma factor RsiW
MTSCINPSEIEGWELEAYLEGDAPPAAAAHIAACPFCAQQVAALRRLDDALAPLARFDCPPADELRQHRWGELPRGRQAEVQAHLAICRACQTEAAAFEGPGPGALDIARDWLRDRLRVLFAVPLPAAALNPARGGPTLAPPDAARGREVRSRVYQVTEAGWQVLLIEGANPQGHVLSGQVFGADEAALAAAQAGVVADDRLLLASAIDATGWFELQPLRAGAYTVWIELAGAHVRLPEIMVGPAPD